MTLPRARPEALRMKYFWGENGKLVRMIVVCMISLQLPSVPAMGGGRGSRELFTDKDETCFLLL